MKTIQPNHLKKYLFWSGLLLLSLSLLLTGAVRAAPEETYLSTGWDHTCAIETDGDIVCWGRNDFGQTNVPAGSGPFSQVSAGGAFTCGLETDGDIVCWGDNDEGQTSVPAGSGPFSQIDAGGRHICGLETDGDVVCWGRNDYGQTDVPAGRGPFSQVSAGSTHTCAVETDGDVICWGDDRGAQVSQINFVDAGPFSQVSAGGFQTCAIETDSDVICWGGPYTSPTSTRSGYSQLAADFSNVCGVKTDGQAVCWASTQTTDLTIPVALDPAREVSIGLFHTCALETDGDVVCWWTLGEIEEEFDFGQTDVPDGAGPFGPPPSDATPPVISPNVSGTPGNNGWYVSDVEVSWSVTDDESTISSTTGCETTVITSDTADATLTCEASSDGGTNSESVTIQRDATPPIVSVTGVEDGATYILGSAPTAGCDTQDALSGVAVSAALTVSGGNPEGTGSFTATCDGATDNAGNNAGPVSVNYTVNAAPTTYNFTGFFSPIDNLPTVNQVKGGQAVPVKFSLNGDQGLSIFAAGYPASQEIACDGSAPINEVEETNTAGNSGLSYDPASDQYSYTWKTDKGWKGTCRQLIVRLNDNSEYSALFQFK